MVTMFKGTLCRKLSGQVFGTLAFTLAGLCYFNYHDAGGRKAVAMLWKFCPFVLKTF